MTAPALRDRAAALAARWRWPILVLWALVWFVARRHVTGDWSFFEEGARLLRGHHPLSMYADAPQLQIGPLALLAGLPLTAAGLLVVHAVLFALGLLAFRAAELSWPRRDPLRLLMGGLLALPCWAFIVTAGHLDDALVVTFTAFACLAVSRDRALAAGLLAGAAVAAKPWALVVVPLVLGLTSRRLRALCAAVAVTAVAWLPFVLGDTRTISALSQFHIRVNATSGLHLLGLDGGPCPAWVRPAQLILGLAVALFAVRRGQWWAAPAAGIAVRVALDPGAMGYYAGGLAVAVLLADGWSLRRIPTGSLLVFVGLFYPAYLSLQAATNGTLPFTTTVSQLLTAGLRVMTCAAVVVLAVGAPDRLRRRGSRSSWPIPTLEHAETSDSPPATAGIAGGG